MVTGLTLSHRKSEGDIEKLSHRKSEGEIEKEQDENNKRKRQNSCGFMASVHLTWSRIMVSLMNTGVNTGETHLDFKARLLLSPPLAALRPHDDTPDRSSTPCVGLVTRVMGPNRDSQQPKLWAGYTYTETTDSFVCLKLTFLLVDT